MKKKSKIKIKGDYVTNITSINTSRQNGRSLKLMQKQGMPVIAFTTKTLVEFFQL